MAEKYTTIICAELRAAIDALRHCAPPVVIHTDKQQLVDGWNAGQRWSCASTRDGADLWRTFWARNNDVGPGINIVKVKAHVPFARVQQGAMTFQNWCGNSLADSGAKAGCAVATKVAPVAACHTQPCWPHVTRHMKFDETVSVHGAGCAASARSGRQISLHRNSCKGLAEGTWRISAGREEGRLR